MTRRPENSVHGASEGNANVLAIFLHGVGSSAAEMMPFAGQIQARVPGLKTRVLDAPDPCDIAPQGRQWFSVQGVTETNRMSRVERSLPSLSQVIADEATSSGVPLDRVVLIGFSQGTIMALHLAAAGFGICAVIGLSGRLAQPVQPVARWPHVHLVHGSGDSVIPLSAAEQSLAWLQDAGCAAELTVIQGQGHGISATTVECCLAQLKRFSASLEEQVHVV